MKRSAKEALANPPPLTDSADPNAPKPAAVPPIELVITENPYKCNICSKSFKTYPRLYMHAKIHNQNDWREIVGNARRFPSQTAAWCPIEGCKRSREGSSSLALQKSINNKKPFSNGLAGVRAHYLRVHAEDKPYKCDICANSLKPFATAKKADLTQHKQTCGKDLRMWSCGNPKCRSVCSSLKALRRHCKHFNCPLPTDITGSQELETSKKRRVDASKEQI